MFFAANCSSKYIIGSSLGFDGDSVKAAKMIRGAVSVGSSRLQVSTSKPSSLMVGANQLSVPYSFGGDQAIRADSGEVYEVVSGPSSIVP